MKKFHFGPERVLDWQRSRANVEEAKLETLYGERNALLRRCEDLSRARLDAGAEMLRAGSATGRELASLDAFRKAADADNARTKTAIAGCERRIEAQMKVVTERRRDVRMLEKLRERKLAAWQAEFAKETETQASDAYLARWGRH